MQILRTILWIALTAILVAFIAMNWEPAPVNFWPLAGSYLHFIWPVGVIALLFFLLGLLPMYLVSRGSRWRLQRRIAALENTLAATAPPPPASPLVATSGQLDAAATPVGMP